MGEDSIKRSYSNIVEGKDIKLEDDTMKTSSVKDMLFLKIKLSNSGKNITERENKFFYRRTHY